MCLCALKCFSHTEKPKQKGFQVKRIITSTTLNWNKCKQNVGICCFRKSLTLMLNTLKCCSKMKKIDIFHFLHKNKWFSFFFRYLKVLLRFDISIQEFVSSLSLFIRFKAGKKNYWRVFFMGKLWRTVQKLLVTTTVNVGTAIQNYSIKIKFKRKYCFKAHIWLRFYQL